MSAAVPCSKCVSDASYSFKKVSDRPGKPVVFYTNPYKAKIYRDHEDLVTHFDHMLAPVLSTHRRWLWVIDGEGFDTDHIVEVRVGLTLLRLLTDKYLGSLQDIRIINPSVHLSVLLKVVLPFLQENVRRMIHVMEDRAYSILEFL